MKPKICTALLVCFSWAFLVNAPSQAALNGKIVMTKNVKLTAKQRHRLPNTVVFRSTTERRAIYVLDINTGRQKALTDSCFNEMLPFASPNGKKVAFTRFEKSGQKIAWTLTLLDLQSGQEKRIPSSYDFFPICWTSNDCLIGSSNFKVCAVDINSRKVRQLVSVESEPISGSFCKSNGNIYFENENHERELKGPDFGYSVEVKTVNLGTLNVKYLFDGSSPKISPDGQRLIYQSDQVVLYNLKSGRKTPISKNAGRATFSPDGKHIAYLQFDASQASIIIRNLDQTLVKKIPVGNATEFSW